VEFRPGPYELELVARETTAGQSGLQRLQGGWPDPDQEPATISPIVLLQPTRGAFVRGNTTRRQGALVREQREKIPTEYPIAFVSVVCRGAELKDTLRVERALEGFYRIKFERVDLAPGRERCAQIRDLIEPGRLLRGYFKYEIRLTTDGGEIVSRVREFDTVSGTQAQPRSSASQGGRPAF
jgi:hypothetical protein